MDCNGEFRCIGRGMIRGTGGVRRNRPMGLDSILDRLGREGIWRGRKVEFYEIGSMMLEWGIEGMNLRLRIWRCWNERVLDRKVGLDTFWAFRRIILGYMKFLALGMRVESYVRGGTSPTSSSKFSYKEYNWVVPQIHHYQTESRFVTYEYF